MPTVDTAQGVARAVCSARGSATPMKMGGGTGTRRQRSQDFLQRVTHTKKPKTQRIWPTIFLKMGRLSPALLKMGGRVPPYPLWRSPCAARVTRAGSWRSRDVSRYLAPGAARLASGRCRLRPAFRWWRACAQQCPDSRAEQEYNTTVDYVTLPTRLNWNL